MVIALSLRRDVAVILIRAKLIKKEAEGPFYHKHEAQEAKTLKHAKT